MRSRQQRIPELGETGRIYERTYIGAFPVPRRAIPSLVEVVKQLPRDSHRRFHFDDLRRVIRDAYRKEKIDPEDPKGVLMADLRFALIDSFDEQKSPYDIQVRCFSALGTPLDFQGVDGFVDVLIAGKPYTLDIDVTMREKKAEPRQIIIDSIDRPVPKIIIGQLPDAGEEEDEYLKHVETIAKDLASIVRVKFVEDREYSKRFGGPRRA